MASALFATAASQQAFADERYLTGISIDAGVAQTVVSRTPHGLPKGWFTRGTFDRAKTELQVTLDFPATMCSDAQPSMTLSSIATGNFTGHFNQNGAQVVGYTWDAVTDLAALQNHWYIQTQCNGTVRVQGCEVPIAVTMHVVAVTPNGGSCTLDNGVCVDFPAAQAYLAAVQDPDVVDDCESSCAIGACVQECDRDCLHLRDTHERQACERACVCDCKERLPPTCSRCE